MLDGIKNGAFSAALRRDQRLMFKETTRRRIKSEAPGGGRKMSRVWDPDDPTLPLDERERERLAWERFLWPGILQWGYEWWASIVLVLASVVVISLEVSPWSELGMGVVGGVVVWVLHSRFDQWRYRDLQLDVWDAHDEAMERQARSMKKILDRLDK